MIGLGRRLSDLLEQRVERQRHLVTALSGLYNPVEDVIGLAKGLRLRRVWPIQELVLANPELHPIEGLFGRFDESGVPWDELLSEGGIEGCAKRSYYVDTANLQQCLDTIKQTVRSLEIG